MHENRGKVPGKPKDKGIKKGGGKGKGDSPPKGKTVSDGTDFNAANAQRDNFLLHEQLEYSPQQWLSETEFSNQETRNGTTFTTSAQCQRGDIAMTIQTLGWGTGMECESPCLF